MQLAAQPKEHHKKSFTDILTPSGTVVMAKRLKIKRKGDRIWNTGIFLGKTEQDTYTQPDGIHITRSVRPLPEQYDAKRTSSIGSIHGTSTNHSWELQFSLRKNKSNDHS